MSSQVSFILEGSSVLGGFFSRSATRNKIIFEGLYDIAKIAYKVGTKQISIESALQVAFEKIIISGGAITGVCTGYAIGSFMTSSVVGAAAISCLSNIWNPLGWIAAPMLIIALVIGGSWAGFKGGEKILYYLKNFNFIEAFNVFDIPYTTNKRTIVERYYQLARKHHPDNGGETAEFQKVNNAYSIIIAHLALLESINILEKHKFEKFIIEMFSLLSWSVTAGLTLINAGITLGSGTYSVYKLIKNE